MEGLQFDVAHTSVLKRAIHTLQGALAELGQDYAKPVNKSWRQRAATTAACRVLDKAETAARHGEEHGQGAAPVPTTSRRRRWDRKNLATDPSTAVMPAWTQTHRRAPNRWGHL